MTDEKEIIVEMLREILGNDKSHYENHGQISFNCPVCDEDRNKGNLEVVKLLLLSNKDDNKFDETIKILDDIFNFEKATQILEL